jgi:hypothetical protein
MRDGLFEQQTAISFFGKGGFGAGTDLFLETGHDKQEFGISMNSSWIAEHLDQDISAAVPLFWPCSGNTKSRVAVRN